MARIKPFRGVRYDPDKADELASLLSPPYDVINEQGEQQLLEQNPHNIIRVELSHVGAETEAPDSLYEGAAQTLRNWMSDGTLITEDEPALYVYMQSYVGPDGKERDRAGFFAAVELGSAVRPHETTLVGPKADRLKLLTATRANVSPIFGLYDDPTGTTARWIDDVVGRPTAIVDEDEMGVTHRLWVVRETEIIEGITHALDGQSIYIADGHHRYETAVTYQSNRRAANGGAADADQPYDYVMMYLNDIRDPGLAVFPIHRVVRLPQGFDRKGFLEQLETWFHVERKDVGNGPHAAKRLSGGLGERSIALYGANSGGYVLRARGDALDAALAERRIAPALAGLDIVVLHELILPLTGASFDDGTVYFVHDAEDAVKRVDAGEFNLAFLLNATRIDDLVSVVDGGLTMPQKSTFFYPKPATGLVLRVIS